MLKKQTTDAFVRKLNRACDWLDIGQGRTRVYLRLLEEFDQASQLTNEHILSYYESYEIVELFELWETRIHQFLGLKEKLTRACRKGPVVMEDEKVVASSNRPRNDMFVYLVAGKLLAAGISVTSVDGIRSRLATGSSTADVCFRLNAHDMHVECKRVNSLAKLTKRAKDARDQIVATGRSGIVAIDCSVIARPRGTLLETETSARAEQEVSHRLEHKILPRLLESLSPQILGLILFARIPAMTATGILNPDGQAYRRRDCISSLLAVGNRHCLDRTIVHDIARKLGKQP